MYVFMWHIQKLTCAALANQMSVQTLCAILQVPPLGLYKYFHTMKCSLYYIIFV